MVTIKDIALEANVAPSTVSNVLNESKYVSNDIKIRVYQAVNKLGYKPNLLARSLKTKQTYTIGAIIPEFNMFFMELINAIERYLYERNYTIIVCCTSEDASKEMRYLENLAQRAIDGLIFLGMGQNSDDVLTDYPVPVVTVDRPIGTMYPSVTIDNALGGYTAANHLLVRGARRIALITGMLTAKTNAERREGCRKAMEEWGMDISGFMEYECRYVDYESGWKAAEQLLLREPSIDGIFCTNDFLAVGALKYLLSQGISVPEKVKLVGFDGTPVSEMVSPAITTVMQPKREMGEKAAEILLDFIERKHEYPDRCSSVQFSTELKIREST